MELKRDTAIILTPDASTMNTERVLGTGGWLHPEHREALDWMTLIALMGWQAVITDPKDFNIHALPEQMVKWVIMATDPANVDTETWEHLIESLKKRNILLITRLGKNAGWLSKRFNIYQSSEESAGNLLIYHNTSLHRQWNLNQPIDFPGLSINKDQRQVASIDSKVIATSTRENEMKILFLSFHPSLARDKAPAFTALLKHLLVVESLCFVAWFDWQNTMILRMDDPGSSQAVHDNSFTTTKLGEAEWKAVGEELYRNNGRMTLAYVPAWVDDGETSRGELEIDGKAVTRVPGAVYASRLVKYTKNITGEPAKIFDYRQEYNAIQKLRERELVEVELHGYTHMHPDRESWKNAPDRHDNKKWFREFNRSSVAYISSQKGIAHPLDAGINAFKEIFQSAPSTLICPGEDFTKNVLEKTIDKEIKFVGSYYLGMRIGQQLCWNQYVCSPYLDTAAPGWFDQELPVVGYFHDFDISRHGVEWFTRHINEWKQAGAKYFIDFREFSTILDYSLSVHETGGGLQLLLHSDNYPPFIKPVRIGFYNPDEKLINTTTIKNGEAILLKVKKLDHQITEQA